MCVYRRSSCDRHGSPLIYRQSQMANDPLFGSMHDTRTTTEGKVKATAIDSKAWKSGCVKLTIERPDQARRQRQRVKI